MTMLMMATEDYDACDVGDDDAGDSGLRVLQVSLRCAYCSVGLLLSVFCCSLFVHHVAFLF